ncbi:HAD family hydrolase [Paenirhodobacter populi]|uniref:phosphoglycolate phosphatase n=1 Tax=Paenirhodobacter populi TaxID=2306993 RepID=A0A443JJY7_9RHOB|nr:HAD family hydrolase [Sinirhodobacter populi]RWR20831.1 HAD family hydrolase [Sinirhodobacter populi]
MTDISAVIFDKDGTLFDFQKTWGGWAAATLDTLAGGDSALADRLARAMRYDPVAQRFAPDSLVIAGTTGEVAHLLQPLLPHFGVDQLADELNRLSCDAPQTPAVDLPACLGGLRARGLPLGLVTNDSEAGARAHLHGAGVAGLFDFIAGYDSGYGAKPEPGQLLAFAHAVGIAPARIAMVGDSLHDLAAARAAGMRAVGVLTGPATQSVLAPAADVVLPDIGGLPGWLDSGARVFRKPA